MAAAAWPTWSWARWTSVTARTTAPTDAVPCAACTTTTAIPATNAAANSSQPAAPHSPPASAARAVPPNTRRVSSRCRSRSGPATPNTRSSLAGPADVANSNSSLASRRSAARRSSDRCRNQTDSRSPATGNKALSGSSPNGGKITARITTIPRVRTRTWMTSRIWRGPFPSSRRFCCSRSSSVR